VKSSQFSFSTSDSLELFGQSWLPERQPKAVINLVHGLGEHSGRYEHLGQFFSEEGFAVLAYDLRGHGQSEGRRGYTPSFDQLLNDISQFLEVSKQQYPDTPNILYGHSLGGLQVLKYIVQNVPEILGAIVTGPLLRPAFEPPAVTLIAAKILNKILPTFQLSNEIDPEGLSHDEIVVQNYINDPLVHDKLTPRLAVEMLATGEQTLKSAAQLQTPLLLMHGADDPITSSEASQEFAEHAGSLCTFHLWEGLYHEIHNEPVYEEVFQYELDWIEQLMAQTS